MDLKFREKAKNSPYDVKLFEKGLALMRDWSKEDKTSGIDGLKFISGTLSGTMGMYTESDRGLAREMFGLYKRALLAASRDDFDSFMLALEANRKPSEQFWRPRRKLLMADCEALQMLEDDELDELFIVKRTFTIKYRSRDGPMNNEAEVM